jgi:hypothetical protein
MYSITLAHADCQGALDDDAERRRRPHLVRVCDVIFCADVCWQVRARVLRAVWRLDRSGVWYACACVLSSRARDRVRAQSHAIARRNAPYGETPFAYTHTCIG